MMLAENKTKKGNRVRENVSISDNLTAHSQANLAPPASSILNHGTAQIVTLWPQRGLQLALWGHSPFVEPNTEGWASLGVLTSQVLGAAVTGVEAEAPTTQAAQMISTMGGTVLIPIPRQLAQ